MRAHFDALKLQNEVDAKRRAENEAAALKAELDALKRQSEAAAAALAAQQATTEAERKKLKAAAEAAEKELAAAKALAAKAQAHAQAAPLPKPVSESQSQSQSQAQADSTPNPKSNGDVTAAPAPASASAPPCLGLRARHAYASAVLVRGLPGALADCNGVYHPQADPSADGHVVYAHESDETRIIELLSAERVWRIKAAADRGENRSWVKSAALPASVNLSAASAARCVAQDAAGWQCVDAGVWTAAPAAMRVCAWPLDSVQIRGITGAYALFNGVYRPEPEPNADGLWIYRQENETRLLELLRSAQRWMLKGLGDRGKNLGWIQVCAAVSERVAVNS